MGLHFSASLFGILFITLNALAKTTGQGIPNLFPHMGSDANNAPSFLHSRLKSAAYFEYVSGGFIPLDSTVYSYSFGRGGQLSLEEMNDNFISFDESDTYSFDRTNSFFKPHFHRTQLFNATNKAISYTCQSWNNTIGKWRDSARYVYTYSSGSALLTKTVFQILDPTTNGWQAHVYFYNDYDGQNNLIAMHSTVFSMFFTYDALNRLNSRTDSQANVSPFYWYGTQRLLFAYDQAYNLSTKITQSVLNGTWVDAQKSEYYYVGNTLIQAISYVRKNNTWVPAGENSFQYDASNNLIENEFKIWDNATNHFLSVNRERKTYNSFGQPTSWYSETYDQASLSWVSTAGDFMNRYYYENYTPTDVANVFSDAEMKIFPQPATDRLFIDGTQKSQAFLQLIVTDVQGKVIWQQQNATTAKQELDISNWVNGVYFLRIQSTTGNSVKQFWVAK
ncbi:MAG: T9SS type A sorting domain-containing protein [Bacteroidetes bacterium]|nr:T9SS type A sorting domain-containing protein [Bacteroidota bacterium]MBS1740332.1 T9SS type A sorting domain-containing protein [Bacteroidota bacterium]